MKFPSGSFNAWIDSNAKVHIIPDGMSHANWAHAHDREVLGRRTSVPYNEFLREGWTRVSFAGFSLVQTYDIKKTLPVIQKALFQYYSNHGPRDLWLEDSANNIEKKIGLGDLVMASIGEIIQGVNPMSKKAKKPYVDSEDYEPEEDDEEEGDPMDQDLDDVYDVGDPDGRRFGENPEGLYAGTMSDTFVAPDFEVQEAFGPADDLSDNPPRRVPKDLRVPIVGVDSSVKVAKGAKFGYLTGITYLHPSAFTLSTGRKVNTCPFASPQCIELCLIESGQLAMNHATHDRKTELWYTNPERFLENAADQIDALITKVANNNKIKKDGFERWLPCVRMNGTSDILEIPCMLVDLFSGHDVIFYDYTKIPIDHPSKWAKKRLQLISENRYFVTFSRSENNWTDCRRALDAGINVAIPFFKQGLSHEEYKNWHVPEGMTYEGYEVIDGDAHDLRFLDDLEYAQKHGREKTRGLIVGLRYKKVVGHRAPPSFYGPDGFVITI